MDRNSPIQLQNARCCVLTIRLAAVLVASFILWVEATPVHAALLAPSRQDSNGAETGSAVSLYLPFSAAPDTGNVGEDGPICRFGVNVTILPATNFNLAALRIGSYVDYAAKANPSHPGGAHYSPIISLSQVGDNGYRSSPSGAALNTVIAGNLGADWIIGNEPDRRVYQDSMVPVAYARAYHDLYHQIKAKDPTARIFGGAIVQPTPLRLEYLDQVLRAYSQLFAEAMPVDGWAIHNFILNERSCEYYLDDSSICWGADIPPGSSAIDGLIIDNPSELWKTADVGFFKEQVVRFRQWMYDRGYADKPLYISEYGILMPASYGFPPDVVNQFMTDTFNYLLNQTDPKLGYAADKHRLVQKLSWFSTLNFENNGSLFESTTENPISPPFKLTAIGEHYRDYTAGIKVATDINLLRLDLAPSAPPAAGGPVTLALRATVGNAGNNVEAVTANVTFYDGDPTAGGALIGTEQTVKLQGCGMTGTAQVLWPNVPPSANGKLVYARLTAQGIDQTLSTKVFFAANQTRLPLIQRGE